MRHEKVPPVALRLVTAEPASDAAEEVAFDRPFLVSEIDTGDETLHVINAHFRAPLASPVAGQKLGPFEWKTVGGWAEGYYLSSLKRTGQALELRLVVDDILAGTQPEQRARRANAQELIEHV